jgi:hypothetical protein
LYDVRFRHDRFAISRKSAACIVESIFAATRGKVTVPISRSLAQAPAEANNQSVTFRRRPSYQFREDSHKGLANGAGDPEHNE